MGSLVRAAAEEQYGEKVHERDHRRRTREEVLAVGLPLGPCSVPRFPNPRASHRGVLCKGGVEGDGSQQPQDKPGQRLRVY